MNISLLVCKLSACLMLGLLIGVLSAPLQAAPNGSFGRLFSEPNERDNLNALRQSKKLNTSKAQKTPQVDNIVAPAPLDLPAAISLQGYVKRNDDKANTLWINNQAVQENSTVDHVKIGRLNKNLAVSIPANGKHMHLKVGQIYEPETNTIYERQVVEKAKRLHLKQSRVTDAEATSYYNAVDNKAE